MSDGKGPATGSHGTLMWTIRTVGIAGFVALAAAQYFARASHEISATTRVAQAGTGWSSTDPETTGSIAQGARSVRLDPCSLPSGTRAPRP